MVDRIFWFPTGPRSKSSSRIQVYNIHSKLLALGYDSIIGYEPKRTIWHLPLSKNDIAGLNLQKDDLVIIQKFKTRSTKRVINKLRQTPARIGYIDCDEPIASDIANLVDFVIVPSNFLQQRYETLGVKCYNIPDCPEVFMPLASSQNKEREMLKCVWFGNHSKSKWKEVTFFKKILRDKGITNWHFETISNTRKATRRWNKNSFQELRNYDLVVIPAPSISADYKVKSANRLLQSMALGLPVLSSPIPSYLDIIRENNLDNIICQSEEEWKQMLAYYSDNEHRTMSIENNYQVALSYSIDIVINDWISAFNLVKSSGKKNLDSKVLQNIRRKAKLKGYEIRFA